MSKSLFFYTLLALLLYPFICEAYVKITDFQGASHEDLTALQRPIVYGGTAGSDLNQDCFKDNINPCDNCVDPYRDCNPSRIYGSLELKIFFTVTGESLEGSHTPLIEDNRRSPISGGEFSNRSLSLNDSAFYSITWGQMCDHFDNIRNGECDEGTSGNEIIHIGIDVNNNGRLDDGETGNFSFIYHDPASLDPNPETAFCQRENDLNDLEEILLQQEPLQEGGAGICNFELERGDEKVFIKTVDTQGNFPSAGVVSFTHARVYYQGRNDNTPLGYSTKTFRDFLIGQEGELLEGVIIDELINGEIYSFRIAMRDEAQNLAFLTQITREAVPEEVFGFLRKQQNCFIVTAATGSPLSKEVQTFKKFRDIILIKKSWGRHFIYFYYKYGAIPAKWIEQSPFLKKITWFFLLPFLVFAWTSLKWGFITACLLLGVFLTTLFLTAFFILKQSRLRRSI